MAKKDGKIYSQIDSKQYQQQHKTTAFKRNGKIHSHMVTITALP